MTDAEKVARGVLAELQDGFAARDLAAVTTLLDDDAVVFGAAGEGVDGGQSRAYVARMMSQDGVVRWGWDRVIPVLFETTALAFAVLGSVGFDDAEGQPLGTRQPFRLTCVAVLRHGKWRLRHFHGSIRQT